MHLCLAREESGSVALLQRLRETTGLVKLAVVTSHLPPPINCHCRVQLLPPVLSCNLPGSRWVCRLELGVCRGGGGGRWREQRAGEANVTNSERLSPTKISSLSFNTPHTECRYSAVFSYRTLSPWMNCPICGNVYQIFCHSDSLSLPHWKAGVIFICRKTTSMMSAVHVPDPGLAQSKCSVIFVERTDLPVRYNCHSDK